VATLRRVLARAPGLLWRPLPAALAGGAVAAILVLASGASRGPVAPAPPRPVVMVDPSAPGAALAPGAGDGVMEAAVLTGELEGLATLLAEMDEESGESESRPLDVTAEDDLSIATWSMEELDLLDESALRALVAALPRKTNI
jgi:hypothetical protein